MLQKGYFSILVAPATVAQKRVVPQENATVTWVGKLLGVQGGTLTLFTLYITLPGLTDSLQPYRKKLFII
jgi:hypothetical protein